MRISRSSASLLAIGLLTSCASSPKRDIVYPLLSDKSTRICAIDKSYFGRVVLVEGIYMSDLQYFSFIQDQHCAESGVIRVYADKDENPSVAAFVERTMAICGESFCLDDLHVAAEGRIVAGKKGHLGYGEGEPVLQITRITFLEKARTH
jgi:hypothetical protein